MAADSTNRQLAREALAGLLATALTGAGNPVDSVYGYQLGDFGGKSPVVLVVSGGSARAQAGLGSARHANRFRLTLMTFVAAADAGAGWSEQDVEDRLDLIDKQIADVLADNRGKKQDASLPWDYIALEADAFTDIRPAVVGGKAYWLETTSVIVEVKDV